MRNDKAFRIMAYATAMGIHKGEGGNIKADKINGMIKDLLTKKECEALSEFLDKHADEIWKEVE